MVNLGNSYMYLGRFEDCLASQEKALEIYQRVLPRDDPQIGARRVLELIDACGLTRLAIGISMNNIANCYNLLGRYQDASLLWEKTLVFRQRVLPEDHPQIGEAKISVLLI
jgi:tetratricopeptide (TPR) repeat protein